MTEPRALSAPSASAAAPTVVPAADRHAGCGGVFTATTISKTETMVGLSATVERRVMRCSKCETERRGPDQVEGGYLATMAAIRETHGLLTPQEIRRIREALGVTPEEFDQLLGLPTGISKGWETLRHLQNPAADARVRTLADVEHAKGVAVGARVTLRLTEEERASLRPAAFFKRRGASTESREVALAQGEPVGAPAADAPVAARAESPLDAPSPAGSAE